AHTNGDMAQPSGAVSVARGILHPRERSPGAKATRRNGTHGAVEIVVRDHGIGIPAAEKGRVFDAFYRIEKGLEHDVKGSGLGLAVVKHVVEAHGGTVQLDSEPGHGCSFTIRLPVGEGEPPDPEAEA
ncbi:MAG TPA: HAMP domain-containing sensor histidine kinase, partial [Candidatus Krumholzibacteria bacterium]|nr:HAMP domain-containing sensor histidine kinase [Candidatus Krumholzibacteria bacterium]